VTAELDLLVVGSGVAGLSAAVRAAAQPGVRVGVLTKGPLEQSTTRWAQGGVAAVLQRPHGVAATTKDSSMGLGGRERIGLGEYWQK
jgi:L-aspartate oxidase